MARGPGTPSTTNDYTVLCGGCLLYFRDLSSARDVIGDGNETRGGGGGDANKSEGSLLSFSRSDLSCHMIHVNPKRVEATEGVL